jgi:hypothetical protein
METLNQYEIMDEKKSLVLKCNDNCSALSVDNWDNDDIYFITTYKSYSTKSVTDRLKDIWRIVKGEDVIGTEIILNESDYDKLRKFK